MTDIHEVIDAIYAEAAGNGDWQRPLNLIQEMLPSRGAFFTGHDVVDRRPTFRLSSIGLSGTDDDYSLDMYRKNDRIHKLLVHPAGSVIRGSELTPDKEFETSEFYIRFMKEHDLYFTGGMILENNFLKALTFGAIREKSAGEFSDEEMENLTVLSRHAYRALKVREVVEDRDASYRIRDNVADRVTAGIFTLDATGRVLMTNSEADALLSDNDGVSIANDRLHFSSAVANDVLQSVLSHDLERQAGGVDTPTGNFGAARPSGQIPYWVTCMPATDTNSLLTAHFTGLPQPRFLIFVRDSARRWTISVDGLVSHYALTLREAQVVAELAAGATTAEICDTYGITSNTLKTHMKRVFDKIGVASQVDLVRTVLRAHGGAS